MSYYKSSYLLNNSNKLNDILYDTDLYLFLGIASSGYIVNTILGKHLKKCVEKYENKTNLLQYDTFIKFLIYSTFIYFVSYYKQITNDSINKIIFFGLMQIIIVLSNLFNSTNIIKTEFDNLYKINNLSNWTNIIYILKIVGIAIILGGILIYNIYNVIYSDDNSYWWRLIVIGIVIGIYILLNIIEGNTINFENNCENNKVNTLEQKLHIKFYFIVFLLIFLIFPDNNYISSILFSILFGLFIDLISRIGISNNVNIKVKKEEKE